MKMHRQDYLALRAACHAVMAQFDGVGYPTAHLTSERIRWDIMHASEFNTSTLYDTGLNDSHIDTALRRIVTEYKSERK